LATSLHPQNDTNKNHLFFPINPFYKTFRSIFEFSVKKTTFPPALLREAEANCSAKSFHQFHKGNSQNSQKKEKKNKRGEEIYETEKQKKKNNTLHSGTGKQKEKEESGREESGREERNKKKEGKRIRNSEKRLVRGAVKKKRKKKERGARGVRNSGKEQKKKRLKNRE
jgi:hypothetical protein